jgi:(S)-ureidoglycine aminohydrolase
MTSSSYYAPAGGHPPQTQLLSGKAVFTESYAVIPKGVMQDIVTSLFPHWQKTRGWILARPLSGFSETFSQYIMEVSPGGGSSSPEPDASAECVLFVVKGEAVLTLGGKAHHLKEGGYADVPDAFVTRDADVAPSVMPGTEGRWSTTRFADPNDLRHDMHVNIVNFLPGGVIPFMETHVMEHGLYVLEGRAVYRLNSDWVEVEAGDFMWLRAFCPQACYAGGPGPFRYLLYKDVNRHPKLKIG